MSDPKSSYGEPVDEPNDADRDVVGRAHEGLAEAEAARRDAEAREAQTTSADVAPGVGGRADEQRVEPDGVPWYERDDVPLDDEPSASANESVTTSSDSSAHRTGDVTPESAAERTSAAERPYAAERTYDAEPATTAEPAYRSEALYGGGAAAAPTSTQTASQQPIFVQAPEAPRARGNRGAAGAIGLLAAVIFAVLYLAAWIALELLYDGGITFAEVPETALAALTTAAFWVPVVTFFLGFWLLGAFINRGRWGHWVVWGILVGLVSYAGHLLGQLFQAPFWELTARQGATLIEEQALAPLAIVAFVLGRELTIWFGAWVAARGRRATELNDEAQREYERTLEAGPQLRQG